MDLDQLIEAGLISIFRDHYIVQKKGALARWKRQEPEIMGPTILDKIHKYLGKAKILTQVQVRIGMRAGMHPGASFEELIRQLDMLSDNSNMIELYEYAITHADDAKEELSLYMSMGMAYSDQNEKDKAVEIFRKCLHICSENDLAAEVVIYHLAQSLFAVNSTAFALEIIRKYSPTTIDPYWKSKIILLKADILAESESFEEAIEVVDEVMHSLSHLEDKQQRYLIQPRQRRPRARSTIIQMSGIRQRKLSKMPRVCTSRQ
jgi:tetratricopeptide (TPR) repeat protein